ncbi:GNAT family N-acetyltransferase [Microbulbifer sp. SA54]|uniref:GNAT family N-acetyltransferase n=1 Tax=Microbulbifer sp. SA54 TaxID=3401577 RepID=UPI003AAF3CA2
MALSFATSRLKVFEISHDLPLPERANLLGRAPEILTPSVTENLPPYFHGIDSPERAQAWLERMLSQSRLFLVETVENKLIGFLFVSSTEDRDAHVGYLLAEEYWGKGLASELLQGFIEQASENEPWARLVCGVDPANIASANLLKKLGFFEQTVKDSDVVFYEYKLARPHS